MKKGVTWWVRSTTRNSGAIEYITPLQRATESSPVPKSVMKTTVGGTCVPADCRPPTRLPIEISRIRNLTTNRHARRAFIGLVIEDVPLRVKSTRLLEFCENVIGGKFRSHRKCLLRVHPGTSRQEQAFACCPCGPSIIPSWDLDGIPDSRRYSCPRPSPKSIVICSASAPSRVWAR